MRVMYFTESDSPHDQRFLRALAGTTHQVYALRQFPCFPKTPQGIMELGWPEKAPDWTDWRGWENGKVQIQRIISKVQPDLLHAGPVQGPALLAAITGFHPLVTMSWGSDLLLQAKRSPWMRFATQFTLDNTDIFLGDCQIVVDEAARYGFPRERMVRFPWGVDLDHFSPRNGAVGGSALLDSLGWHDRFVILCNRTWAPLYGVDVLAKAFAMAVQQNPGLRLILAGDGPQSNLIHQILAPVIERVSFPGRFEQEDLPGLYCAADLYVSPSHSDGSSVSLLEALACGRPVLVSDIPSNREWVIPEEVGGIFRDGDEVDLSRKMLMMAEDQKLGQYGRRARVLAEARADWDKNFQRLLSAYQKALHIKNSTRG